MAMAQMMVTLFLLGSLAAASAVGSTGNVIKVLPFYLDFEGRDAVSPSLFDRDAYQARLREHPKDVSGLRFDVLWTANGMKNATLSLRTEVRGVDAGGMPRQTMLEKQIMPGFFRSWTGLTLSGEDYKNIGSVVAWRVTIWNGDQLLDEQKSFLW